MKTYRTNRVALVFALTLILASQLRAQLSLVNIGHTNNGGTTLDVALSGNDAFVTAGTNGMFVYDISNPALPLNIGHVTFVTNSQAYHLFISNNYAYVTFIPVGSYTGSNSGFGIYDISQPSAPSNVFHTNLYPEGGGVTILGTNLYIGADSHVPTYSLSNAAVPVLAANPFVSGNPTRMAVNSNFFASIASQGLLTSTVSNGILSVNVSATALGTNGNGVAIVGQYAFVATLSNSPLLCYQILTKGVNLTGAVNYPTNNPAGGGYSLTVSGNYAFVGCGNGLRVVNISDTSNLVAVAQTATSYGGTMNGVAVSGPYAYVANGTDGLRVFQIVPSIVAQSQGGLLTFSWPATSSFALQEMPLNGTNWTTLTNVPVSINGTNQISMAPSGSGALFRLINL